jgi:hypothetical protein
MNKVNETSQPSGGSMKLTLTTVYQDEGMLRRAFAWIARVGAGPKFGSRPIAWYQMHNCAVIDYLLSVGIKNPVCKNGVICERGQSEGYFVAQVYDKANRISRGEKG